ncbi:MAG: hypothetical protein JXR96_28170 [Deltaproteobacteria bacterium]|nr:hypothetical protein [Deltaproteobacteria bacterium]
MSVAPAVLLLLAEIISVVPSLSMVRLSGSEQRTLDIMFRNLTALELSDIELEVDTAGRCEAQVRPARLASCLPSDRCGFSIRFSATDRTPRTRFPVMIRMRSRQHADLRAFRMLVDALPGPPQAEEGWIDVGVLRVEAGSGRGRMAALAILGLVPLLVLLGLGIYLKRRTRGS